MSKALVRDLIFALVSVILAIGFDIATLAVTDLPKLQQGPDSVLAVHFDLLLIAASLVIGAHVNRPKNAHKTTKSLLFWAGVAIVGVALACFVSVCLSVVPWVPLPKAVLTAWIPDALAGALLAFCAHAAWETA